MGDFSDELKGGEEKSRTWYFAKPPQSFHGLGSFTRPPLVIQMQRFSNNGKLVETIDMASVGYFRSLFLGNGRTCHTHAGRTPRFMWTIDVFSCSDTATFRAECPSQVIVGTAIKASARTYCNDFEWRFCGFNICVTMTRSMDGSYDIFVDSLLVARWKPRTQNQVLQSFELLNIQDMSVIAEANRDALTVLANLGGLVGNPSPRDTDGPRQVRDDATAFGKPDLITISTGSWLVQEYFKSSA